MFYCDKFIITILFLSFGLCMISAISDQLKDFHKAFDEAKNELQDIKSIVGDHDDRLLRKRRRTIDDLLANFEREVNIADDLENGDSWYRELRAKELKNSDGFSNWNYSNKKKKKKTDINDIFNDIEKSNQKSFSVDYTDNIDSILASPFETKHQESRGANTDLFSITNPLNSFDIEKDVTLNFRPKKKEKKEEDEEYVDPNPFSYERTIQNIHFPSVTSYEPNKIDYSHEANYKLSKVEQDAAEKKKIKPGWKNTFNKRSYTSNNFNPMNEIKLKTSHRLMRKGMGPSLPSNSLSEVRHEMFIDDVVKRLEKGSSAKLKEDDNKRKNIDALDEIEKLMYVNGVNNQDYIRFKRLNQFPELVKISGDNQLVGEEKQGIHDSDSVRFNMNANLKEKTNVNEEANLVESHLEEGNPASLSEDVEVNVAKGEIKKQPEIDIGEQKQKRCTPVKNSKDEQKKATNEVNSYNNDDITEEQGSRFKRTENVENSRRYRQNELLHKNFADTSLENQIGEESENSKKTKRDENYGDAWKLMTLDNIGPYKRPILRRSRRHVFSEDELIRDNRDFDSFETNEDSEFLRFRRSTKNSNIRNVLANIEKKNNINVDSTIPLRRVKRFIHKTNTKDADVNDTTVAHVISKREVPAFDELEDNNSAIHKYADQLAEYRQGAGHREEEARQHKKRQDIQERQVQQERRKRKKKPYDLSEKAKEFDEEFDNLKQKDQNAAKFDGSKFDNLWYDQNENNNKAASKNTNAPMGGELDDDLSKYVSNINQKFVDEGKRSSAKSEKKEKDKNLVLSLGDQILNCTSIASLEKFLKGVAKANESAADSKQDTKDDKNGAKSDAKAKSDGKANEGKNSDSNAPKEEVINIGVLAVPTESTNNAAQPNQPDQGDQTSDAKNKKDMMKLNITINASVLGDQKAKNYFGNGTINVEPGHIEERNRRDLKRYNNNNKRKSDCDDDNPLEGMLNGKVSTQVVKSVFSMVRTNPKLKVLWPSLRRNRFIKKQMDSLYPVRNQDNEMEVQKTERLLKKVMETINSIVDQEVRAHTCVSLRPDLVEFYELILRTSKENEKGRDKRDNTDRETDADFAQQIRSLDPNKIEEKSRIVKKLLKQYEELPQEDQDQVVELRDDLLSNLLSLHKLKVDQDVLLERRKRNSIDSQKIRADTNELDLLKEMKTDFSPAFLKLLKTSELFREASEEDQI
ncbi:interaptin isoform X2 [Teleopsis dalmanni]|uniref:interaptin isoform X2 n=1 Tax=Teleopsis dalmanni TaxID=139649 RepID=UPI0018CD4C33|nr:interaptin isoform X2 [Teleopsis dalmanni]